jgi:hypothetical protein
MDSTEYLAPTVPPRTLRTASLGLVTTPLSERSPRVTRMTSAMRRIASPTAVGGMPTAGKTHQVSWADRRAALLSSATRLGTQRDAT